jgi:glutamine cyclotransferase
VTNFAEEGKKNFSLYVSDGTDKIQIIDGDSFETIGSISVRDEYGSAVKNINELEYAKGLIWANIWFSTDIIGINP